MTQNEKTVIHAIKRCYLALEIWQDHGDERFHMYYNYFHSMAYNILEDGIVNTAKIEVNLTQEERNVIYSSIRSHITRKNMRDLEDIDDKFYDRYWGNGLY